MTPSPLLSAFRGSQDYRNLPVAAIMTHDVLTMSSGVSVEESIKNLGARGLTYHAYPIMDAAGDLLGVVTRHELEESPGEALLDNLILDQNLLSVQPDTSIRDAANRMIANNYQQVPVVLATNSQKLLGLITLNDIARQQNASEL